MQSARYVITPEDSVAYGTLHFDRSVKRAAPVIVTAMVVLSGLFASLHGVLKGAIMLGFLSVCVGLALFSVRFWINPRRITCILRKSALLQEPQTLTLSDQGFSIVQPSAHVEMTWGQIKAWDENERVLALYVTGQLAYILPKRQINSGCINAVRGRLVDSGLTVRGSSANEQNR